MQLNETSQGSTENLYISVMLVLIVTTVVPFLCWLISSSKTIDTFGSIISEHAQKAFYLSIIEKEKSFFANNNPLLIKDTARTELSDDVNNEIKENEKLREIREREYNEKQMLRFGNLVDLDNL